MKAVLFAVVFALLLQSALCAKYTETITAGCKSKSACSPKLTIQGGVGWTGPAQTANICAGKPENSLVVNDQAELVLCLTDLSTGVFGAYQLTGARNSPDYLLTTGIYPNKGSCEYFTYSSGANVNQRLKNRILQLENLWDEFDEICDNEYGSDYVAATPVDAMFAMKGTAAPLDTQLDSPELGTEGVYNVRGGYFFWYQANGELVINDARWALFPVYSDCYGGQASSRTTTLHANPTPGDLTVCANKEEETSADYPMSGFVKNSVALPGRNGAWGPVLCRRRDLDIQSVAVPGPSQHELIKGVPQPTCSSLFGSQFSKISLQELSHRITAPMSQGAYSASVFQQFGISTSDSDQNLYMPYTKDYQSSELQIRATTNPALCDFSTVKLTCSRQTFTPPPLPP